MKSDIVIEENNGKKTGYGLVFLQDEDNAIKAKMQLDKQKIGSRYVEILLCTNQDIVY